MLPIHPRRRPHLSRSITSLFLTTCIAYLFAGAAFAAHHGAGEGEGKGGGHQESERVCKGGPDGQCPHGGHGKHGRSKQLEKALASLELSDEVQAKVDALIADAAKRREPIQNAMHATHDQLRGLMKADVPDRSSILGHADQMGRLRTELDKIRLTTLLDVRALLDPGQRAALDEALASGCGHHGKCKGGKGKKKGKGQQGV